MPTTLPQPDSPTAPGRVPLSELRSRWGWFVALGAALIALGVIALLNTVVATVASVWTIAALMLVGAVFQIMHAFSVKTWSSFFWWLLAGVIYAVAGMAALSNPLLASSFLTLLLAGFLIAGGVIRIFAGLKAKADRNWGWIVFSGAITLLAGVVIALGWPFSSLWVLGTFLAVDLLMQGFAMVAFGMALKR